MQITDAAVKYVQARTFATKQDQLPEFERMLTQWENQRTFRWANVNIDMDVKLAEAVRAQLIRKRMEANIQLEQAEEALRSFG